METALIEQAQELHAESEGLEERLQFIEQQMSELREFITHLSFLENNPSREGISSIGKGVFLEAQFKTETLLVDVGNKIFVRKSIIQVKEIIAHQLEGLQHLHRETEARLQEIRMQFESLVERIETSSRDKNR